MFAYASVDASSDAVGIRISRAKGMNLVYLVKAITNKKAVSPYATKNTGRKSTSTKKERDGSI